MQQDINSPQVTTVDITPQQQQQAQALWNYRAEQEKIKRQRALAQQMLATPTAPNGQMVSGHYVPKSWAQGLAEGLQQGLGAYQSMQSDKAESEIETRRQAEIARMLGQYNPQTTTPQEQLALAQGLENLGAGGLANAAFRMRDQDLERQAQSAAAEREEKRYQENLALRKKEVEGKLAGQNQPVTKVVGNEVVAIGPDGKAQVIHTAANPNQRPQSEPEKVSLIVTDRNGNRKLDSSSAEILQKTHQAATLGAQTLGVIDSALVAADKAPSSWLGQAVADVSAVTEATKSESRRAQETVETAQNAALSFLAMIDPRAKGSPSISDIEGLKKTISDPNASPAEKKVALSRAKAIIEQMVTASNTALGELDDESVRYMRGVGVNLQPIGLSKKDEKEQAPAAAPAASQAPAGRVVSMAQVQAKAAQTGLPVETVIEQARAAGFSIGQ